jgi:hypothetical protein
MITNIFPKTNQKTTRKVSCCLDESPRTLRSISISIIITIIIITIIRIIAVKASSARPGHHVRKTKVP